MGVVVPAPSAPPGPQLGPSSPGLGQVRAPLWLRRVEDPRAAFSGLLGAGNELR